MNQSKKESLIEKLIDIGSGFIIALILQYVIFHICTKYPQLLQDYKSLSTLVVTVIFTITSFTRSYFWRRFFNNGVHKIVHSWVRMKMDRK